MDNFTCKVEIRWADLDPNLHLRHSVYYDFGAYCRIEFLAANGITAQFMHLHHFGPILFREECIFKKEIQLGDKILIDVKLVKANREFTRWTMQHQIFKNNETLGAILTLDGAWMDTMRRKLTAPPLELVHALELAPRTDKFEWLEK